MSVEICEECSRGIDTDEDMGVWDAEYNFMCQNCVENQEEEE